MTIADDTPVRGADAERVLPSAVGPRVSRGANLIARNLECLGAKAAAEATADHIRTFWAPQLRATLLAQAQANSQMFSPIAREAIAMLVLEGRLRPST